MADVLTDEREANAFMLGMNSCFAAFEIEHSPENIMKVMDTLKEVAQGRLALLGLTPAEMKLRGVELPAQAQVFSNLAVQENQHIANAVLRCLAKYSRIWQNPPEK